MYALQKYSRDHSAEQVVEHFIRSHHISDSARAVCDVKSDGRTVAVFLSILTLFGIMIARAALGL